MKVRVLYSLEVDDDIRRMIARFNEASVRKTITPANQQTVREFFENHGQESGFALLKQVQDEMQNQGVQPKSSGAHVAEPPSNVPETSANSPIQGSDTEQIRPEQHDEVNTSVDAEQDPVAAAEASERQ
jgi:hypothetical protein